MRWIGTYLLQVTAAAVICGIFKTIVGKKSGAASLVRILCAVFMALTILSPLSAIDPEQWITDFTGYGDAAQAVVEDAKLSAEKELAADIKKRTEAYILDKAKTFGVTVAVDVSVSAGGLPIPVSVRITGAVPPYARKTLSSWLQDELDIPLEEQKWVNS